MSNETTPRMVLVRWLDSSMVHSQVDAEDLPTPTVLETVGWLSREAIDHIVVSRDYTSAADSFSWRSNLAIPRDHILECLRVGVPSNDGYMDGDNPGYVWSGKPGESTTLPPS